MAIDEFNLLPLQYSPIEITEANENNNIFNNLSFFIILRRFSRVLIYHSLMLSHSIEIMILNNYQ